MFYLLLNVNVLSSPKHLSDLKYTQNSFHFFRVNVNRIFVCSLENSNSKHLTCENVTGENKTCSINCDLTYFIFVFMTCIPNSWLSMVAQDKG